ncbi:juvenile hormone epoxide hydrolase 1-like isoform X2 [Neocloeon triangulifer]|nr:juvenile hormone epoxide hydrolase 1-like isoform X2 [Neocloeon triangulifer]XP_059470724.1 juvenile hormone epoxide hydrolase 1-like isoform X2 [Neocloeon triangulifer]
MFKNLVIAIFLVLLSNLIYKVFIYEHPVPDIDKDAYWGAGQPRPDDISIKPFKIQVPDSALNDLKTRLDLDIRYQKSLEGVNFEYGMNPTTLLEVVDFWKNKYNWREREAKLNSFPQFLTQVSGLRIHYVHAKPEKVPSGVQVLPLLLLHGWPGTVKEFHALIPMLTKPHEEIVFEVIAPSLPGYGFSEAAHKQGLSTPEMAVIFQKLMNRLGFKKFYLQGGDWGSLIATDLSILYPERVLGLHVNMCGSMSQLATFYQIAASLYPPLFMDKQISDILYPMSDFYSNLALETGYMHIQATKPDTIGNALANTPVGLAAYILEKFSTWTDNKNRNLPGGGLTEKYKLEDLLDNIMIYWLTGNIASSMRLYSEVFNKRHYAQGWDDVPCKVPTVCARFPSELLIQPEFVIRLKYPKLLPSPDPSHPDYIVHRPPRGGHFAAFEEPELLANSVFKGFRDVIKQNA